MQYKIKGSVSNKNAWHPYVRSVFLSERWLSSSANFNIKEADILLIPIVAVQQDDTYHGQEIEFDLSIQDVLKSGGWGKNIYHVKAGARESLIELHQKK